ncbi:hypothetical protein [Aureibacter tunicatorum]|uniref:Uncharacterized protein n=1 Tax=Aureibacter tunicatorum TaxID=866807 RepID=A0AAE3XRU8_9BACT|nr:hypothetical protein [Aureibacter tunicatorum]MDR6240751.1 hypothetical protein [Aureibacter tunicatorum]BDD06916.1 hypothetical protein AUTU_43990 [Aureibacter tunicatorum]
MWETGKKAKTKNKADSSASSGASKMPPDEDELLSTYENFDMDRAIREINSPQESPPNSATELSMDTLEGYDLSFIPEGDDVRSFIGQSSIAPPLATPIIPHSSSESQEYTAPSSAGLTLGAVRSFIASPPSFKSLLPSIPKPRSYNFMNYVDLVGEQKRHTRRYRVDKTIPDDYVLKELKTKSGQTVEALFLKPEIAKLYWNKAKVLAPGYKLERGEAVINYDMAKFLEEKRMLKASGLKFQPVKVDAKDSKYNESFEDIQIPTGVKIPNFDSE